MTLLRALGRGAGGFVLGGLVGVGAVLIHPAVAGLGTLLAALVGGVVVLALTPGLARFAFAAGWGLVVMRAAVPRPEGDFLVAADAPGYLLLGATLLLGGLAVVTTPRRVGGASAPAMDGPGSDLGN